MDKGYGDVCISLSIFITLDASTPSHSLSLSLSFSLSLFLSLSHSFSLSHRSFRKELSSSSTANTVNLTTSTSCLMPSTVISYGVIGKRTMTEETVSRPVMSGSYRKFHFFFIFLSLLPLSTSLALSFYVSFPPRCHLLTLFLSLTLLLTSLKSRRY